MTTERARIFSLTIDAPGDVEFDYNPTKVSMARRPKTGTQASPAGFGGSKYLGDGLVKITLSDVVLDGPDTKARCDLLMGWAAPPKWGLGDFIPFLRDDSKLPDLMFQWGKPVVAFCYGVNIVECSVAYVRFNRAAEPTRAQVTLTLEEQPNLTASFLTNPTSGGLPGRRSHLVCEGDNVTNVATRNYGHPKYGRSLAAANGIDDPLRLKPGTRIYVPNSSELPDEE